MKTPSKWPTWVHYTVWCAAAAFGFGVALVVTGTRPVDSAVAEKPVPVTCRGLAAEPGFYAGRLVRLDTVGMRPGDTPEEVVYARVWGLPPAVVAKFDRPAPVPIPAHIVGRCHPVGTVVYVAGCRAD